MTFKPLGPRVESAFQSVLYSFIPLMLGIWAVEGVSRLTLIAVALFGAAWLVWSAVNISLEVDVDRVVVRNHFRKRVLRWNEIDEVTTRNFFNGGPVPKVAIGFRESGTGRVFASQATVGSRRDRELIVDALKEFAKRNDVPFRVDIEDLKMNDPIWMR